MAAPTRRVVIAGAAGRDFHNFNVVFRDDPDAHVVAFTAAQIPGIGHRRYPAALAGAGYPSGIPIEDERDLEAICRREHVTEVVFAYSDVTHEHVMHVGSRALATGADFVLLGPDRTALRARVPVIAVCAARTGTGKSQVTRWLNRRLRAQGVRTAVMRHPMPYGDLERQAVQRFASREDLDAADCTVEEREEYEPHLEAGSPVFAGVDYRRLLELAEAEADLLLWDGGNNDFPFVRADLLIGLVDALRPGHADRYHPGETVIRMADAIVVAKCDAAEAAQVEAAEAEARSLNPDAPVLRGASPVRLDDPTAVRGRRALVVDDGPTLTHGGMPWGAGYVAARAAGATIIDPRPFAAPAIRAALEAYPHIGAVLPALGYGDEQTAELRASIIAASPEVVVAGTPIDLDALLDLPMPVVRARYEYEEASEPGLGALVDAAVARLLPVR